MEDIRLTKELGLPPKTLMKNNPTPMQRWKLPVKHWIRELHARRFGVKARPAARSIATTAAIAPATEALFDDDVPF